MRYVAAARYRVRCLERDALKIDFASGANNNAAIGVAARVNADKAASSVFGPRTR